MPTAQERFEAEHRFLPSSWGPDRTVPDFNPAETFLKQRHTRRDEAMRGGPDELMGRVLELEIQSKTLRSLVRPAGGGGASTLEHPFQIQRIDDDTVNVRFGTLNDIVPTDVATDIDVSGTNTYTFYLDVEIDIDGVVVAVTLSNATSGQPPDDDYHGYITLGTVVVASSVITATNQAATHSLRMAMCGREVSSGPTLDARGTYEFWGF